MATRDQPHLLSAVRSLLSQAHQNFTLTIVDEGQQLPARRTLATISDARVHIIEQPTQGHVAALNIALKKSKPASFVGVVYASCFYAPYYLNTLLKELLRFPAYCGVFCHYQNGDTHAVYAEPFVSSHEILVRDYLGPGVLFRTQAFRQAGNLFLSKTQGLLETWQRMQHKVGPWLQVDTVGLRRFPDAYDHPPVRPRLNFDKQIYPHVKPAFLVPEGQSVDPEFLVLLSQAGHPLTPESEVKGRTDFVLCGDLKQLAKSLSLAEKHYAPLLLILNDSADIRFLETPRHQFLLASCHVLTRNVQVARACKALAHDCTVYMPDMTDREIKRFLCRFPLFLYRQRCVFLIRSLGGPELLRQTLSAIQALHAPTEFAEVVVFSMDNHPQTLRWLTEQHITHFKAQEFACYPEFLFVLQQMAGSFVCGLNSGMRPMTRWFQRLRPLLAHPAVGLVSGHINDVRGPQRLPFFAPDLKTLQNKWETYRSNPAVITTDTLHDGAFLTRKTTYEYLLKRFPDTRPLSDDYTHVRLLNQLGFQHLLHRGVVAFNQALYL